MNVLADDVPLTLKRMQCSLGLESKDWFVEFVVCPKCHSIYEYKDCVVTSASGIKESKCCCHNIYYIDSMYLNIITDTVHVWKL